MDATTEGAEAPTGTTVVGRTVADDVVADPARPRWYTQVDGTLVVPLALFAMGMWLTRHALGGAFPEGDDVPYHLARSVFGYHEIFRHGHLDGWAPLFGAGSQNFLLYGPGVPLLFTLVKLVSFGQLADTSAFALVMCLSYASIGPAAWFMARSIGLGRGASGLTGVAAMTVSIPFSIGIAGIFDLGLVANGMAAPWFCLGVGFLVRTLFDRRRRDQVGLAVASAAMLVTHLPTATSFAITAAIVVIFAAPRLEHPLAPLRPLVVSGVVTVGLAAFWLLPLAAHHDPRQPLADWGTPPWGQRLEELAAGRFAFTYWPAMLVALGFVGVIAQPRVGRSPAWRSRLGPGLIVAGPILMAVSFLLRSRFIDVVAVNILPNRTSGYVVLLLIMPAAQGWTQLWARLTAPLRRALGDADPLHLLGAVPAATAAVLVLVHPAFIPFHEMATARTAYPPGVVSLADALRRDMAPHARFAFAQDDQFRSSFAIPHPEMWIAHLAGRNTVVDLGGNSVSSFDNFIVDHIWDTDWNTVVARLTDAGVSHLLVGPQRRVEMARHREYAEVYHDRWGAIFRRVAVAGYPTPDQLVTPRSPASMRLDLAEPEHLRWTKSSTGAVDVTVGVAYFEKWSASFDGRALTPYRTADGLVGIQVPAGAGTLALDFERDGADALGAIVTAVTVLGLLAAVVVARRRARRSGGVALLDGDRVDDDVVDGAVTAGGGDVLGGLEHVESGDELAEQRIGGREPDA